MENIFLNSRSNNSRIDSEFGFRKFACLLDIFINEKGCLYDAFVVLETASNDKYRNVLLCEMLILCLIAKVYRVVSNMYEHIVSIYEYDCE